MSPRPTPSAHDDLARRQQLAADIVADALIAMMLRERLRELDARDAVMAAETDERARPKGTRRSSGIGAGRAGRFTSR